MTPSEIIKIKLKKSPNLCLSGGATGADEYWGVVGRANGYSAINWTFDGHLVKGDPDDAFILKEEQLRIADGAAEKAGRNLGRHYPPNSPFIQNLLRRNYFQILYSKSLYAITSFDKTGGIVGGTAWAVQMFLDSMHKSPQSAYVYCQDSKRWHAASGDGDWIYIDKPPRPQGIFTGIGSRKLNLDGILAIQEAIAPPPPLGY